MSGRRGPACEAEIEKLEARIKLLEDDARRAYADLLEVQAVLDQPRSQPHSLRHISAAAEELRRLYADLESQRAGVPSLVTVVIPAYQKIDYTLRCLRSIAVSWETAINPTIVVVDDASPDESAALLLGIRGVNLIQNGSNLGYLRSTNRGALLAQTPFVCFLNNDTEVCPGWLGWLVEAMGEDPKIGAVGSKLLYPDGTLQEAGSIIWSDATGWNYGRGQDPLDPAFNVRRDVDFCSAASLLIRTDLLREIGGFDERYAPAYYEDADLCFEVRARGYRTIYEPRSEIVHYEGISSGTDITSGVKRFQEVNRPKFAEKWAAILPSHFAPSAENVAAAVKFKPRKTILIVDSYVPMHDREAGSARLFKIITILREIGMHVIFLPDNFASVEPYTTGLVRLGVEVLFGRPGGRDRDQEFRLALKRADVVWVCRPELSAYYLPLVRDGSNVPFVYDTIDLHFAREQRRIALEGGNDDTWRRLLELELRMCRESDMVVTVTDIERKQLEENDVKNIAVIPTIHDVEEHEQYGFDVRTGIIFIGGYGHTPNVDAAFWLVQSIMPIVWERIPDLHLTLLGNQPPPSVVSLRSSRVAVPGFIPDVSSYFEEARLFVAPLRYGAGMKGKVGQALSYRLPVVTTSVGGEGYSLVDGENCFIADDASSFAAAILRVYQDRETWARFAERGMKIIEDLGSNAVQAQLRRLLENLGLPLDVS